MKRWQALMHRYAASLGRAWKQRNRESDNPLNTEWAFMAPALALQRRPLPVLPRLLQRLIIAVLLCAVAWAAFGQIDVVASATGKVVPSGRSKVVQPSETGVIRALHVRDGQRVMRGQVLIELDNGATAADVARLEGDLLSARIDAARASAIIASVEHSQSPHLPHEALKGADPSRRRAVQRWLDGQYLELRSQLDQADAEIARTGYELASLHVTIDALKQAVPIARELVQDYEQLLSEQAVAKHQYLQRKQEYLQQQRELDQAQARIQELAAAMQAATHRRASVLAQQRRAMLDLKHEAELRESGLVQELQKARLRHGLRTLTAPVDGTVQQLAVHTLGGVVTEAQTLMVVVPNDHPIEVEAFLANKDIGFVHPGQPAQVKVETFSYTRHGLAQGVVTSVSHDAIEDPQRGLVYAVRIGLDSPSLERPGYPPLALAPGMAVTAEITTRKRRLISYFLTPLEVMVRESLQER